MAVCFVCQHEKQEGEGEGGGEGAGEGEGGGLLMSLTHGCGLATFYHPRCFFQYAHRRDFKNIACVQCRQLFTARELDDIGVKQSVYPCYVHSKAVLVEQIQNGKHVYFWNHDGMTLLHHCLSAFADPQNMQVPEIQLLLSDIRPNTLLLSVALQNSHFAWAEWFIEMDHFEHRSSFYLCCFHMYSQFTAKCDDCNANKMREIISMFCHGHELKK